MSQLFVSKKNEAFLQVSCDEGVANELSDYFAFFVPGYQFSPMYKNRIWDGKIRLFDRRFYTLPCGIVGYLQKFAADRQYQLTIDDPVLLTTNFSIAEARDYAQSLQLPHAPHDYQIEAFARAIRNHRLLIISPTASGKSLIIYMMIRRLQSNHKKGVIVVPTTSLVEQLYANFEEYGWDAKKYCNRVYTGMPKHTNHYITISTWQSLSKLSAEYLAQFDFVIGDEAHQFKAKEISRIMNGLVNADVRIGTTGTLDGTKTHRLALEGHFGPVFQGVTTKQLMDQGHLSDLKIKCLVLKYPEPFCQEHKKDSYQDEYGAVISHPARKRFIRNLALSLEGNTLILFQLVDKHGRPLFDDLKEAPGKQVYFIHGDVETEERERIRKIAEQHNNLIIVASYGTFSTGINIRNLHNVIFAAPSKSRIRNLQSIGRGLRKADGKEHATLFDIVDDLRIKKHVNFLLKHYIERAKIYTDEKFTFKQYHIDLGGS